MKRHDTANITCQVNAEPPGVNFRWRFNSSGVVIDLGRGRAVSWGSSSSLPYTPASPGDYGLLLCSADNAIGEQVQPCVFNITEKSKDIYGLFKYFFHEINNNILNLMYVM